jgi:hypothetical protein
MTFSVSLLYPFCVLYVKTIVIVSLLTLLRNSELISSKNFMYKSIPSYFSLDISQKFRIRSLGSCFSLGPYFDAILSRSLSDYRRGLDLLLPLLTIYTHDSELQAITAPPLISTTHKSPQHPLSLFSSRLCLHQPFSGNGF